MPRILITGATGLVGSHAAALWTERGWRVRALVRPRSDVAFLEGLECELVLGDVTSPVSLRGAARDCQVVLHAAAWLGVPGTWESYRAANVDGTANILAESLERGVPRFLHLSTVAVYGAPQSHARLPIDEESPIDLPVPPLAYYERSKRMAEALVRAVPVSRLAWTILRPDVVVGERDRHFTRRIVELARYPFLPLIGSGDNPMPVVYVGNVALALWLAAGREDSAGRTYNVTGDGKLTQRELFEIAAGGEDGARLIPLPAALLEAAALAYETASSAFGGTRKRTRERVWFLAHRDPFDSRRIRRELGWDPPVPIGDGWRRAVAWYRQAKARARAAGPRGTR